MKFDGKGGLKVIKSRLLSKATWNELYSYICIAYAIKADEGENGGLDPDVRVRRACEYLGRCDEAVKTHLAELMGENQSISAEKLVAVANTYSHDALEGAVNMGPFAVAGAETPRGVTSLALAILSPMPGERFIDCGSGTGSLLTSAREMCPEAHYFGVEIDQAVYVEAKLKSFILGYGIDYINGDMFSLFEQEGQSGSYDKAFSNYPWGIPATQLYKGSAAAKEFDKVKNGYNRPVSGDWVFNRLLIDAIGEDGTAVGIMTGGSAFNSVDAKVRKHFVDQGWIRAVIALPEGVFYPYVSIGTTLVVLGHGNTGGVRIVDATDLGTDERRMVNLGEEDVGEILARLASDGKHSRTLTPAELAENEYNLYAPRYLREKLQIPCPKQFGDVVETMTRGASLKASELDELTCTEDTGAYYLGLSDIQDGIISVQLPCLKSIDPKLGKYCVRNGDLLVSKTGSPIKVAVAEVADGNKVLACGNLYIVHLNDRVDPYYLAAYLSSSTGAKELSAAIKGTLVSTLNASDLKQITIPLEPMERQQEVAARYRAKLDEIQVYKLKLEKARAEVADIFSEEG
ncbi:N-6 DNA methylase [Paratractidigestivibacter sp.]|uniref:N-6 DNA methylase n=1 Tax=Paratractidigestivibacter sp. TaxID=2847316 RepID=UPI002AC93250|nr:N-6 DNA methylase [Paratractidigestivibacter sp.]